jgi:ribosomal protein S27AE
MTESKEDKKCPKCESELHYVEQMGQHYCFSCEMYFEMVDAEKKQAEETKEAVVTESKAPQEVKPEEPKKEGEKPEEGLVCPSCGEPAVLMEDTKKYYCYSCEDYIDLTKTSEVGSGAEKVESASAIAPVLEKKSETVSAAPPTEAKAEAVEKKAEPPEAVIVKELEKEERKSCQDCGSELIYVQKYDRWYCQKCRKYAPKEAGAKVAVEPRKCPTCKGDAKFIEMYNRWYCYRCQKYLPTREEAASAARISEAPACPYCGKPLTWIAQYQRYYCYPCKKYAPKEESLQPQRKPQGPICPDCGKQTTWIQTYERYYCYHCRKYVQAGGESKAIPEMPKKAETKTASAAPLCEICGKPTTWIAQYQRYYCYPCKKYVPLSKTKN